MSESATPKFGTIGWTDLTVPDAEKVRDFYSAVCGWRPQALAMQGYDDYVMLAPDGETTVAGICHARGSNTGIPAQWMNYVTVPDLEASLAACVASGGTVARPPVSMGSYGTMAIVSDPAGAVLALMQPSS